MVVALGSGQAGLDWVGSGRAVVGLNWYGMGSAVVWLTVVGWVGSGQVQAVATVVGLTVI